MRKRRKSTGGRGSRRHRRKRLLSAAVETNIAIDWLHDGDPIYLKINRSTFEDLCKDLFQAAFSGIAKVVCQNFYGLGLWLGE